MQLVWSRKFIWWNILALFIVKAGVVYVGLQLAVLLGGPTPFTPRDVIAETNDFRSSQGAPRLAENTTLNIAAAQKLEDMARQEYFAHFSPAGTSPWHWFAVNKYTYSFAGENLAIGFLDASSTVDAWSQSASHRKNLVNSNFKEIGVAVARVKIKDIEGPLVVQLFGSPAGSTVAVSQSQAGSPLSLGVSQGSAQESRPSGTPAPRREEPTRLTPASPTPLPLAEQLPDDVSLRISSTRTPGVSFFAKIMNRGFMLYAFLVVLASLFYLLFVQFKRSYVAQTAAHVLVLLLAVFLPLAQPVLSGIIR